MSGFCSETTCKYLKYLYLQIFFNLKIFHVFLVEVLKLISFDQNINMHILFKIFKVYLHLFKTFFGGFVQILQFFL